MGVGIEFFSSNKKIRASKSDVLIYSGAGYEARTRFPASHELRSAIRRNPTSPLIGCALRARVEAARSLHLTKKQDIQIGCPVSVWSGLRGSNSLPPPWQGGALPDELSPRNKWYFIRREAPCQENFFIFCTAL